MTSTTAAPLIGIVDDDDAIRAAISSLIRSTGYRTVVFASGEALLLGSHKHDVRCLVLDVQMPGMSGREVQHRLAAMKVPVPIIFLTADADDVRAGALADGAVAVLGKPFNSEDLLSAIASALKFS